MKTHTKPYGYGAWTPKKVEVTLHGLLEQRGDGYWQPAKPLAYRSFFERIVQAWHVLTYQADALYWYFEEPYERRPQGFLRITKEENITPTH